MLVPAAAPDLDPRRLHEPDDLERGLAPRSAGLDEARHRAAVERAGELYRRCVRERPGVPAIFRPGGEWEAYHAERRDLYELILAGEDEAAGERLRSFWRNELGALVKEYASYEQLRRREQPRTDRFRWMVPRNYLVWREIVRADPAELAVPDVGEPWGLMLDDVLVTPKATRFHALARQVAEIVRDVRPTPTVVEIGAGFGGMATYLLRDAPAVRWIDLDLPETLVIAAYWLIAALPEVDVVLHGERPAAELLDADGPAGAVLLPNHLVAELPAASADLAVNTFSFSEMPRPTLDRTLAEVTRITRGWLLHQNMDRAGVVNRGHARIPASDFPLHPDEWRRLHVGFDLFHGQDGDYREFLLQRRRPGPAT